MMISLFYHTSPSETEEVHTKEVVAQLTLERQGVRTDKDIVMYVHLLNHRFAFISLLDVA